MSAIFKRELKSYFCSMTGVIFSAFLLVITGIYTVALNLKGGYPIFEYSLANIVFIFSLALPIVTMRSFSEDMHSRTDQLLYSLPLPLYRVVLAKYFAMAAVLAIPTGIMCLYPVILSFYGKVNFASAYGAILAFFFLGCALVAIGMFLSSLTESQVIAAVLTFGAFILMNLMNGLATLIPYTASASLIAYLACSAVIGVLLYALTKNTVVSSAVGAILLLGITVVYLIDSAPFAGSFQKLMSALALFDRFDNFASGIFDITAIVYYVSVAGLFTFFTVQSMDKKRWA